MALRSGTGGALWVTGGLGAGTAYLLDGLPDKIRARGLQVWSGCGVADDGAVPYSLAAQLVAYTAGLPIAGRFSSLTGDAKSPEQAQEILQRLEGFGVGSSERAMAGYLSGLVDGVEQGAGFNSATAASLVEQLVRHNVAHAPLVMLCDHADQLDALSWELLGRLAQLARELPLLLCVTTTGDHDQGIASHTDPSGQPLFERTSLGGSLHTVNVDTVWQNAPPLERQLMTALALAQQPLPMQLLGDTVGADSGGLEMGLAGLEGKQALRRMDGDRVMLSTPELQSSLGTAIPKSDTPWVAAYAEHLLAKLNKAEPRFAHSASSRWTPTRIRLLAWSGQRSGAAALALAYSTVLHSGGWLQTAIDHCQQAAELFQQAGLGSPQAYVDLGLSRAYLCLERLDTDGAERALSQLEYRAVDMADDKRLLQSQGARAELAFYRDMAPEAFALATRVASTASLMGEGALLVQARLLLARWQLRYGNLVPAQRHVESALNLLHGRVRGILPAQRGLALELMVSIFAQLGHIHQAASYQSQLERWVRP
ncbi:MAG: hypothetical protein AAFX99_35070, partial [Myxococcota bacterium]